LRRGDCPGDGLCSGHVRLGSRRSAVVGHGRLLPRFSIPSAIITGQACQGQRKSARASDRKAGSYPSHADTCRTCTAARNYAAGRLKGFQQILWVPKGAFAASFDGSFVLAHQIEGEAWATAMFLMYAADAAVGRRAVGVSGLSAVDIERHLIVAREVTSVWEDRSQLPNNVRAGAHATARIHRGSGGLRRACSGLRCAPVRRLRPTSASANMPHRKAHLAARLWLFSNQTLPRD
jgi:hypothetical protein